MADTIDNPADDRSSIWRRPLTRHRLRDTPLRDLLRGRVTGRLDWRGRLRAGDLPAEARELIERVVRRTRLWRSEKADVADELVAHFADALAAGESATAAIAAFGDRRQAARLLRRAKKRNRPLAWHALKWARRALGAIVVLYAIVFARFWFGRPTVSVDYLARLNAPVLATPPDERGWPLYRRAMLALDLVSRPDAPATTRAHKLSPVGREIAHATDDVRMLSDATPDDAEWPELVAWFDAHADGMRLLREAAAKPAVGFVFGPDGDMKDPELGFGRGRPTPGLELLDESFVGVMLPALNPRRQIANLLGADARVAAARGDGGRAVADFAALIGIARQADAPLVVVQLVDMGVAGVAFGEIERALARWPAAFTDAQLVALAHHVAAFGGDAPASLLDLAGERMMFHDIIQRTFTDDGRGDGRLTASGARAMGFADAGRDSPSTLQRAEREMQFALVGAASALSSRRETLAEYDRLMDLTERGWRRPLRETAAERLATKQAFDARAKSMRASQFAAARDLALNLFLPSLGRAGQIAERALGRREGIEVGIALELYRRRHGDYPQALDALAPNLLPKVPADRITGEPVKYRLIDGRPVVYSVGVDRDDDAARPAKSVNVVDPDIAAQWSDAPTPDGDWILYDARPVPASATTRP